jgi:hypothetical protein
MSMLQRSPIRCRSCVPAALGMLVFVLSAPAAGSDVPVVNPGFEDISGESPFFEFTFGPLNGWDLYDPNGIADGGDGPVFYIGTLTPQEADPRGNPGVYVNFPDGAAEGERVAIAFNFAGSDGLGPYGLEQHLDAVLEAETEYTLRVEIGNIASGTSMSGRFFDLDGFPGYRVDLLAGGVVIAQDLNTLGGLIPEGEFATSTVSLVTGADHPQLGQTLGIRLVNLNILDPVDPGANLEVDFDDVRLTAEPVGDPCPGDLSGDDAVGPADLAQLLAAWGPNPGSPADFNGDGVVGPADLAQLLAAWGPCP